MPRRRAKKTVSQKPPARKPKTSEKKKVAPTADLRKRKQKREAERVRIAALVRDVRASLAKKRKKRKAAAQKSAETRARRRKVANVRRDLLGNADGWRSASDREVLRTMIRTDHPDWLKFLESVEEIAPMSDIRNIWMSPKL